jgi:hypothetical protein
MIEKMTAIMEKLDKISDKNGEFMSFSNKGEIFLELAVQESKMTIVLPSAEGERSEVTLEEDGKKIKCFLYIEDEIDLYIERFKWLGWQGLFNTVRSKITDAAATEIFAKKVQILSSSLSKEDRNIIRMGLDKTKTEGKNLFLTSSGKILVEYEVFPANEYGGEYDEFRYYRVS